MVRTANIGGTMSSQTRRAEPRHRGSDRRAEGLIASADSLLVYCPSKAKAACAGALEIWISPAKGLPSSAIMKIAPATARAAISNEAMMVAFGLANRPKLMKIAVA
jgi:hypothetical protein